MYYQYDPQRVSMCTLIIHGLLHIAPSIRRVGPVWTYWAFPTERFCGFLNPAIKSRKHPWTNLDNHLILRAQITQIMHVYNIRLPGLSDRAARKSSRDHVENECKSAVILV